MQRSGGLSGVEGAQTMELTGIRVDQPGDVLGITVEPRQVGGGDPDLTLGPAIRPRHMERPAGPPEILLPDFATREVEVVFCIDTTGSMGGLLKGAQQKIWSICNQVAGGRPTPALRVGLVAYRDKGDEYVTRVHDLGDDLDAVYADLKTFVATGMSKPAGCSNSSAGPPFGDLHARSVTAAISRSTLAGSAIRSSRRRFSRSARKAVRSACNGC